MNELALFAGAGGGILGSHLLGWQTICAVEINPYARSVLLARQNDRTLPPFPIWDDIRTFDGRPWRGIIDVVSGGFPCQDISCAGRGKGITGERSSLWKEMHRVITEVRPQFVFVENSPMLRTRGLDVVLKDLSRVGYDTQWGIVSAENTGALHRRKRIWIMGNTDDYGQSTAEVATSLGTRSNASTAGTQQASESTRSGQQHAFVANTLRNRKWIQQIAWKEFEDTAKLSNDGSTQSLADSDGK